MKRQQSVTVEKQSAIIAQINDHFRRGDNSLGHWTLEASVEAMPQDKKQALIQAVRNYDNFTQDNDPYGEHDFGIIHQEGTEYFWLIDCYDQDRRYLATDPSDIQATTRVLVLTKAEEY